MPDTAQDLRGRAARLQGRRTGQRATIAIASFGAFLAFLDATIVNVAFPSIQASFPHDSLGTLSWILNAYNIVFAALLVAGGRVADLAGRRRTFLTGVLLFMLASALCGLAPDVAVLVSARVVQAVGGALLVPASLALVTEAVPRNHRAHAIGLWGATAAVAAGLGPPLGGFLVDVSSWRLAFFVNVPLALVAMLRGRGLLTESRAPGRRRLPDLAGTAGLAAALGLLTLGIVQGSSWGWTSAGVVGALAAAVLAVGFTVRSSRRHPSPIVDPALLRMPTFGLVTALTAVASIGFYAYLLGNILWLRDIWRYSLLEAGLAVVPGAVLAALVAAVLGPVAQRRGFRVVAVPGAVVWAGAYAWYALRVGTGPDFLGGWLPGQVLSGLGAGATLPILNSAALAAVPGGRFGTAAAVNAAARQVGAVLGVAILVGLIGVPTAASYPDVLRHGWLLAIGCFGLVAAGAVLLGRPAPPEQTQEERVGAPRLTVNRRNGLAPGMPAAGLPQQRPESIPSTPSDASLLGLLDPESVVGRLARSDAAAALGRLLAAGRPLRLAEGQWLLRAGEPSDSLYVVVTGRLELVADGAVRAVIRRGGVVGELGVLTGSPRSADVRAGRDCELLRLDAAALLTVLGESAPLARAFTRILAGELQRRLPEVQSPAAARVVAVVAAHPGAPVEPVMAGLLATMRRYVRVADPGPVELTAVDRAEREHDRVLLRARLGHEGDTEWWRTAVRRADRLVVVACGGEPAQLPDLPPHAAAEIELVLAGGDSGDRRRWIGALAPRQVHHLDGHPEAEPAAASLSALARRLSGRAVGLALAGGGARALAHVGVIEELVESGYLIDRVSGCSMGSFLAGLFALGLTPDELGAVCYDEFVRRSPANDYTVPRYAVTRGHKTDAALRRNFGDLTFSETARQLVVVSTDLFGRRLVVHREGLVAEAVRASLSLPGLFPPYPLHQRVHVDGGVLQNLPVQPLAAAGEGPVIAVDIGVGGSGTRSGAVPARLRIPTLGETLLRLVLMGSVDSAAEAREQAAVVVSPDTRDIGLLEFHQLARAREAGRVAGRAVVEALAYGAEAGDVRAHLQEEPVDVVAVDREDRHRCGDDARL